MIGLLFLLLSIPLLFAPVGRRIKYFLLFNYLLFPVLAPFPPVPGYLTPTDLVNAETFYADMNEAQWDDYWWHVEHYGLRQAIIAGMEGSHIPRGRHGAERSYQDLGVSWGTAHLFRNHQEVHANIHDHDWIAGLSAEIDDDNLNRLADSDSREGYRWYAGGTNPLNGESYSRMAMAREVVRRGATRTPFAK